LLGIGLGACAGACLSACGEKAPEQREEPPPPKPHADGGEPDVPPPYDGTCSGITCPATGLGSPGCCTHEGTGQEGHELANVGRGADLCGTDIGIIVPSLRGICLQLSQPGEVDDDCPPQVSIAGGDARPGCCTDEGYCGSLDEFVPLGCFYATGLKGRRCGQGSAGDAGFLDGGDDSGVSDEDGGI
jgi:hypothetical protein